MIVNRIQVGDLADHPFCRKPKELSAGRAVIGREIQIPVKFGELGRIRITGTRIDIRNLRNGPIMIDLENFVSGLACCGRKIKCFFTNTEIDHRRRIGQRIGGAIHRHRHGLGDSPAIAVVDCNIIGLGERVAVVQIVQRGIADAVGPADLPRPVAGRGVADGRGQRPAIAACLRRDRHCMRIGEVEVGEREGARGRMIGRILARAAGRDLGHAAGNRARANHGAVIGTGHRHRDRFAVGGAVLVGHRYREGVRHRLAFGQRLYGSGIVVEFVGPRARRGQRQRAVRAGQAFPRRPGGRDRPDPGTGEHLVIRRVAGRFRTEDLPRETEHSAVGHDPVIHKGIGCPDRPGVGLFVGQTQDNLVMGEGRTEQFALDQGCRPGSGIDRVEPDRKVAVGQAHDPKPQRIVAGAAERGVVRQPDAVAFPRRVRNHQIEAAFDREIVVDLQAAPIAERPDIRVQRRRVIIVDLAVERTGELAGICAVHDRPAAGFSERAVGPVGRRIATREICAARRRHAVAEIVDVVIGIAVLGDRQVIDSEIVIGVARKRRPARQRPRQRRPGIRVRRRQRPDGLLQAVLGDGAGQVAAGNVRRGVRIYTVVYDRDLGGLGGYAAGAIVHRDRQYSISGEAGIRRIGEAAGERVIQIRKISRKGEGAIAAVGIRKNQSCCRFQ